MKIISELKVRELVFTFACGLFVCFGIANLIGTGQDALWAFTLAYTQGLVARNARQCREVMIMQDNIVNLIIKEAEELCNRVVKKNQQSEEPGEDPEDAMSRMHDEIRRRP